MHYQTAVSLPILACCKTFGTPLYIRRGLWQALNCLSIHATYCVIVAGASPGETKMWAAVHENSYFSRSWIMSKRINICSNFFHHRVATPFYYIEATQTRSIAQPLCDSRASCEQYNWLHRRCEYSVFLLISHVGIYCNAVGWPVQTSTAIGW